MGERSILWCIFHHPLKMTLTTGATSQGGNSKTATPNSV